MLSVITLSVSVLNGVMLCFITPRVSMLSGEMTSDVILDVIILRVVC